MAVLKEALVVLIDGLLIKLLVTLDASQDDNYRLHGDFRYRQRIQLPHRPHRQLETLAKVPAPKVGGGHFVSDLEGAPEEDKVARTGPSGAAEDATIVRLPGDRGLSGP